MYNFKCTGVLANIASPHNSNYVVFLYHQSQPLYLPAVFGAGGHNIGPGGIDAAVSQDVGQLCNVLLDPIKGSRKKLPQIMGKDLGWIDTRRPAQPFHLRPYIASVQRLSVSGNEDGSASDAALLCIAYQQFFQLARNQNGPGFAFALNRYLTAGEGLYCKEFQFRHPDTGAANRLKHQIELFILLGCRQQPQILRLGQLLILGAIGLPLAAQVFHLAVRPAKEIQQTVDGGKHGIDGADRISPFLQRSFIRNGMLLGDRNTG